MVIDRPPHLAADAGPHPADAPGANPDAASPATSRFRYRAGDRPLPGYTIDRAVGRGGFGDVYYALSDGGREVAIKTVDRGEHIELRGIRQCMNLKSPHLVSIFDVQRNDAGELFVIMEFVGGPSLEHLLRESPTGLGPAKAAYLLREIAAGVTVLHDSGVVHRDLKPANIFYDEGVVKIGDYGLSKAIGAGHHSMQTVTVGTVHYMAPEVGGGRYDRAIDIYAMGVMLYEMVAGSVPFEGDSLGEVLMKHVASEPDVSILPAPFDAVVARAMAKRPEERFPTAAAMVGALFDPEHVRNSVLAVGDLGLSVAADHAARELRPAIEPVIQEPPPSTSTSDASQPAASEPEVVAPAAEVARARPQPQSQPGPTPRPKPRSGRRPYQGVTFPRPDAVHRLADLDPLSRLGRLFATVAFVGVLAILGAATVVPDEAATLGVLLMTGWGSVAAGMAGAAGRRVGESRSALRRSLTAGGVFALFTAPLTLGGPASDVAIGRSIGIPVQPGALLLVAAATLVVATLAATGQLHPLRRDRVNLWSLVLLTPLGVAIGFAGQSLGWFEPQPVLGVLALLCTAVGAQLLAPWVPPRRRSTRWPRGETGSSPRPGKPNRGRHVTDDARHVADNARRMADDARRVAHDAAANARAIAAHAPHAAGAATTPPAAGHAPRRGTPRIRDEAVSSSNRSLALGLAIVGFIPGSFVICGLHRLYCGKVVTGVIWLLTGGLFGVGQLVDLVLIAAGRFRDADGAVVFQWGRGHARTTPSHTPTTPGPTAACQPHAV